MCYLRSTFSSSVSVHPFLFHSLSTFCCEFKRKKHCFYFQTVVQRGPHYVGAGLAFGLGLAYCWLQTRLSWKLRSEKYGNHFVAVAQLVNSIALTVFLLLCILLNKIRNVFFLINWYLWFSTRQLYIFFSTRVSKDTKATSFNILQSL